MQRSVYKVLPHADWQAALAQGAFAGSPDDRRDGYIHLSTATQLPGTLARFFAGAHDLVLVRFDPATLGNMLRWEPARDGQLFPHLYAPLPTSPAASLTRLHVGPDGRHVLPEDLPLMFDTLFDLGRQALLNLDPERAHEITIATMERGLHPRADGPDPVCLKSKLAGLDLPNPVGIAAGFDKDARVPDAVLALGCGFAEVGTLTPHPQEGNPRPRLFRLPADRAVINRFGFNNGGHRAALDRLIARRGRGGAVGVNIGANKDSTDRTGDYVAGLDTFYEVASYFTVNISSPNTPGLRDLQAPAALDELLGRIMAARAAKVAAGAPNRPIVVKIAPDIAEADLPAIADRLMTHRVDMIAVSNTTLARPASLRETSTARQAGGLSGPPLFQRSTAMLARVHQATGGRIPLIGIGGIDSGATALAKIEAGATLLQLYSSLVYEGAGLITRIKTELADHCRRNGLATIGEATGSRAAEWASKPLDA